MKKIYFIICLAVASLTQLQAQAPQGFNYQATVRNSAGDLIVNTNVYFKFNIMQGSQTSLPIFAEVHYAPTDDLGHVSLVIGEGTASTGIFSEIDWSLGSYYLGIELDTGNGYVAMGTSQLLSVPYALFAENSGNAPTPNLEAVLSENNSANNLQIKDLQDPIEDQDAVTKTYVDNLVFNSESSSRYQMDSFSFLTPSQAIFGFNIIDTQTGIVRTYFRDWNWDNYSFYRITNTHPEINSSSNGRFQVSSWSESVSTYPYQKLFGFNVIDTESGTIKCFRNIYPGEAFYECSTTNPIDSTYDFDGDGFSESQGDCDDTNESINPEALEICDGIDNDCDGLIDEGVLIIFYQDSDSDGFGNPDIFIESCSLPNGYSSNNLDCDDQNPQVNPQVTEIQDGIDNDCDGIIDEAVLATLYTNTILNITINSAQSGGTIIDVGGGTVSSSGIVWSTSSTPTLENNEGQTTDGSGSGSFVSSLTALN
ncbi:MAG: putative metal-binding motif-containing protein, partial [Bacteroidia bacterium]|nr:putative metal-binding motif-containing protein [Bacteroidia bacterium]